MCLIVIVFSLQIFSEICFSERAISAIVRLVQGTRGMGGLMSFCYYCNTQLNKKSNKNFLAMSFHQAQFKLQSDCVHLTIQELRVNLGS